MYNLIMNFKKNDLVGDIIKIHEQNGWELVDQVGFNSPLANIRKLKNKDVHRSKIGIGYCVQI